MAEPTPVSRESEPQRAARRLTPWPWLLLAFAAALGVLLGVEVVLRGRSLGPPSAVDAVSRPTFVIGTPVRPAAGGSPLPDVTSALPDSYTVASGDTLRSIAQQVYGDADLWPRIYDANRDAIGPDPDTLRSGTVLRIPRQ
jgi:nucleoid-associated protein YgaU